MSRSIAVRSCKGPLPMFSVEDVRQFVYCPRIIYFRYVLRNIPQVSIKMRKGSKKHDQWRKRQIQRGESSDIFFGLFFKCEEIGLCGLLDAVEYDGETATPIELKTGTHFKNDVSAHHRAQVIAQCVLLESCLNVRVKQGIVIYSSSREQLKVDIGEEERAWLEKTLSRMRDIVFYEELPRVCESEAKCVDCEYWMWCFRV